MVSEMSEMYGLEVDSILIWLGKHTKDSAEEKPTRSFLKVASIATDHLWDRSWYCLLLPLNLQEMMRQGHKTCLYYPLFPNYVDKQVTPSFCRVLYTLKEKARTNIIAAFAIWDERLVEWKNLIPDIFLLRFQLLEKHSLIAALDNMVPVRSRRQIAYPRDCLGENAPSDRVIKEEQLYALNHANRKLTLEPKVEILTTLSHEISDITKIANIALRFVIWFS